jgi:hypothetical protein
MTMRLLPRIVRYSFVELRSVSSQAVLFFTSLSTESPEMADASLSRLLVFAFVPIPGFCHCKLCLRLPTWFVGRVESLQRPFLSPVALTDFSELPPCVSSESVSVSPNLL